MLTYLYCMTRIYNRRLGERIAMWDKPNEPSTASSLHL